MVVVVVVVDVVMVVVVVEEPPEELVDIKLSHEKFSLRSSDYKK